MPRVPEKSVRQLDTDFFDFVRYPITCRKILKISDVCCFELYSFYYFIHFNESDADSDFDSKYFEIGRLPDRFPRSLCSLYMSLSFVRGYYKKYLKK